MIKAILIFNNHGKPRLIRFYQYFVSIYQAAVQKYQRFALTVPSSLLTTS